MNKSLTPLIAVFALIILLTLIIINSDFNSKMKPETTADKHIPKNLELSPDTGLNSLIPIIPQKSSRNSELINIAETFDKAKRLLTEGRNDEAEEMLRTLLIFDPKHFQALSLLGGILYYSNRYDCAEIIFRRQITLEPHNHLAYNRLGSALAKQNKIKEAIVYSSTAVGINPESGEAHINLSGMYSMIGEKEKAVKHFKKAYNLIGEAILPLSYDEAFNHIRSSAEFQTILLQAKQASEQRKKDK